MPGTETTLPGRDDVMPISGKHFVNGNTIQAPFPDNIELACFAMGCFWGAEKVFWLLDGVYSTAVGYSGGQTRNANYQEVCTGHSGHTEVVLVAFDPSKISYSTLLTMFWENHDPTQGMRQGNDRGTQYRSGLYYYDDTQKALALQSGEDFRKSLEQAGYGAVTTEILPAPEFYFAEDEHQQYLAKNPHGYCGLGGTGVSCS